MGRFIYWILVLYQGDVSLPLLVSCSVPSTPELICSKKNKTSFGEQHSPRRVAV